MQTCKRTQSCEECPFWRWMGRRRITDTPSGDFVRDTHDLLVGGVCPETVIHRAEGIVERLYHVWRQRYERQRKG